MELYINNVDIGEGIIVSIIVSIMIAIFYLYKKENSFVMWILVSQYKCKPAELQKDTRRQDWFLLFAIFVLILVLGLKLVTLMVVVSDSMTPEFERGDMILTQSIDTVPEVGNIITFRIEDATIAVSHRVISIDMKSGIIKTKGDNNPYPDNYKTTQKDVIAKAIIFNDHPIVIKGVGALFITDYKAEEGVIFKFGDQFTFMQNLSQTIKVWGYVITIISLLAYILMISKNQRSG
jgi:signal peptidase I